MTPLTPAPSNVNITTVTQENAMPAWFTRIPAEDWLMLVAGVVVFAMMFVAIGNMEIPQ